MQTKPFSVRLSESLTKLVQGISAYEKKTPSDFIREAVEEKATQRNDYRSQLIPLIQSAETTLVGIREKLAKQANGYLQTQPSRPEISFMMMAWHKAYMQGSGYANPAYLLELLDITKELLKEALTNRLNVDYYYFHSCLGLNGSSLSPTNFNYDRAFSEIKHRTLCSCSISCGEMLTRPLEVLASHLDQFPESVISDIFTTARLKLLLPLVVRHVGPELSDQLISQDMDLLLPHRENFDIGDLSFGLVASPFALVVSGEHHCYAFSASSLMFLAFVAECESLLPPKEGQPITLELFRDNFHASIYEGTAVIHENTAYRLSLTEKQFIELRQHLTHIFANQKWKCLLDIFRNLKGDI